MMFMSHFKHGLLLAAGGAMISLAATTSATAQQCPDWQIGGTPIATDAEVAWVPQQYPLFAGGGLDLGQCASVPGHGFINAAPNFSLSYDAMALGRDLEFRVESECDTTMLINDSAAQWHYNDDTNGLQPAIRLAGAQTGRFDIWVGTYGSSACAATLIAETFEPAGQMPAAQCPDWSLGGAEVSLMQGGSETRSVVAGGSVNMFGNECGIQAHGYVAQGPDFTLYLDPQNQVTTLDISVQGECDTLLLVNDPSTNWIFNDDDIDLQPRIEIGDAQAGRYDIRVGTYGSALCNASMTVRATSPQAPAAPAAPGK